MRRRGFTLTELLIVIGISAVLAAVLLQDNDGGLPFAGSNEEKGANEGFPFRKESLRAFARNDGIFVCPVKRRPIYRRPHERRAKP